MNTDLATLIGLLGVTAKSDHDLADASASATLPVVCSDLLQALYSALELVEPGVLILDIDARIVWCNPSQARWLDHYPDELLHVPVDRFRWSCQPDDTAVGHALYDVDTGSEARIGGMPWQCVLAGGSSKPGVAITLHVDHQRTYQFRVSVVPIGRVNDTLRGCVVFFERALDSALPRSELERTLESLRRTQAELAGKNEQLYKLATIDPLSGILNRRAFFEAFEAHFQTARSTASALACIMVDIDHFKSVNDSFGHALGDVIIEHLGSVLIRFGGIDGVAGRLGGEEFCLLIPGLDETGACSRAETMRRFLESGRDATYTEQVTITASFGVAAISPEINSPHRLIELADRALYRAKQTGRNRVVGHRRDIGDSASDPAADALATRQSAARHATARRRRGDTPNDTGALVLVEAQHETANRSLLLGNIEQAVENAGHNDNLVAIIVLDSSSVMAIASRVHHDTGVKLTAALVNRIGNLLRSRDVVSQAALDSDPVATVSSNANHEIVALVNDIDDAESVPIIVERVLSVFNQPIVVDGFDYRLETHVGVSVFGVDGTVATELLQKACSACSDARQQGEVNNYRFYSEEMDAAAKRKIRLQSDLYLAMQRGEMSVVYQPKLELDSGSLLGFEALLRWQHGELGPVSPVEFIPIAERSGYIKHISRWVMREVAAQVSLWQGAGVRVIPIAVNVSAGELQDPQTAQAFIDIVEGQALSPDLFEIEITESMGIESHDVARSTLATLRNRGFRIAIDDFGTGYASLNYLQQLPVDRLKIDRCFIDNIATDSRAGRVVRAIISLGNSLGIKVLAEGVETVSQLRYLLMHQCHEVQGYLLSKPVEATVAKALLCDHDALATLINDARQALIETTPSVNDSAQLLIGGAGAADQAANDPGLPPTGTETSP